MLVLQVFVMRNGAFEGTEMVSGDRIEIGRDANASLQLDDESCSRRHAVIFEHDGKLAVQDLGSANGTRVNGEPVTQARFIGPRDDIAIGIFTLKVKLMTGQSRASAPPSAVSSVESTRLMAIPGPQPTAPAPQAPAPQPMAPQAAPSGGAARAKGAAPTASSSNVRRVDDDRAPAAATAPRVGSGQRGARDDLNLPATEMHRGKPPTPPVESDGGTATRSMGRGDITVSESIERTRAEPAPTAPTAPTARGRSATPQASPAVAKGASSQAAAASKRGATPMVDFDPAAEIGSTPKSDALDVPSVEVPAIAFAPQFLPEDLHDEGDEDPPWSLVQSLVRPSTEKSKNPLIEVVHYRGETVVDHRVVRAGEMYKLGEDMTRAERKEHGIPRPIPIVRLKPGGVAEIFLREEVQGRLLRGGQQVELQQAAKGKAVPITDGELASLKVGTERVFVRFASSPQLLWTREDAADDRLSRRITGIALGSAFGIFVLAGITSWIYQYRNADQDIIALEDDGFAEVEQKPLEMEPPPPEEKPPEPIPMPDPEPTKAEKPQSVKPDPTPTPTPPTPAPKPGVMDLLNNIPKVQDTASSQSLTAAMSNIKGVRVPGGAGYKVSSLVGKGPSAGVQFGGAAGGLSTSGINSLLRKDGAAGALGGKGDRAISGKVTALKTSVRTNGGELSKEEIQKVINSHIGEIQFCYEKALRTQPGLAGRVSMEWTVSPSGAVSKVQVAQSTMNSNEAVNCMSSKLKNWKFPPPRGGAVTIVFPFVFNAV